MLTENITSAVSAYILSLFDPDDLIAITLLRDREVQHRFAQAQKVASPEYLATLQKRNDAGWHIYICMNPLLAERRVKTNIACIRTVYLDIDRDGTAALTKLAKSPLIPKPHFILQSSPEKFQVIWSVDGLKPDEQERLLDVLIREFGGDPAASDMVRVLRLPGFINHKYAAKPVVELLENNFKGESYTPADFKIKTPAFKAAEPIPDIIPDGKRNDTLISLAGSMQRRGINGPVILTALRAVNQAQCHPPLDDSELINIARSAANWPSATKPAEQGNSSTVDEAQIQNAVEIYQEVLGRGKPVRTVDFIKRFFDARLKREHIQLACNRLAVILTTAEDGWMWASAPEGGFPAGGIFADELLPEFPAIAGSIQELAEALCPDIPREFKIMAAVTRVGLAISEKVQLEGERHLQPRFYTCFIAEAGRGKTAAIKETRILDFGYREVPSVDSAPALVDTFAESNDSPRRLLLSPDEAVDLFEKAKTSRDSRNSLFTELLKLYEDNTTGNRARRNQSPIEVHDAHLAIICGATPSGYDAMWIGSKGASGGLQSRFLPIVSTAPQIPARQRSSAMQRVHSAVERIRHQIDSCGPTLITMTPEAEDAFKSWWGSVPKDKPGAVRVEALVKRFLMVMAVTNDTDVIDASLMAVGIKFGSYIITVRETYNPADASSWVQAFEARIEKVHQRAKVPITRDRCRKLVRPDRYPGGYGDFIRAYGNLVQAGRLTVQGQSERAPKYGLD